MSRRTACWLSFSTGFIIALLTIVSAVRRARASAGEPTPNGEKVVAPTAPTK